MITENGSDSESESVKGMYILCSHLLLVSLKYVFMTEHFQGYPLNSHDNAKCSVYNSFVFSNRNVSY